MKNYGLDIDKIVIRKEDWRFGANLPLKKISADGQYDTSLPEYEAQADKYETWGCTVWGLQNHVELALKFLFNIDANYIERYNYNLSEVSAPGCDPNIVYEDARKHGFLDVGLSPLPDTYEEFCTPRPMTESFKKRGELWKTKYEFYHEWIIPLKPEKMKEAIVSSLFYSPGVTLSVTAWSKDSDGLYIDGGLQNNHWCLCYGYRNTPEGIVLKIFDTYDHSKKEIHPNHTVSFAKRIHIEKIEPKLSFWARIYKLFMEQKLIYRAFKIFNIENNL